MPRILPYGDESVREAAAALRAGEPVAFATETVYGLGARTLDEAAIERIYALKGRPSDNPLIAHVLDVPQARTVSGRWDRRSLRAAAALWPGPLTMILPRAAAVPRAACGGLDTIAVRSPVHPLARCLLYAVNDAISAPSANRSGEVSPTSAEHVAHDYPEVPGLIVLDGGPCRVGIESTVVDLCESKPVVRRLGSVSIEQLVNVLGPVEVDIAHAQGASPGSARRHYSPRTRSLLLDRAALEESISRERSAGYRVAAVVLSRLGVDADHVTALPAEGDACAAALYDALRRADAASCDVIVIERPARTDGIWAAIQDRLERATA
ncbi:MAG: threonylcarbamoyl-AMP synthase [Phycisphaerales bacterium]|nr:threonylcarbamoyl-AMP synthase [Phycisphaerales bacterium]